MIVIHILSKGQEDSTPPQISINQFVENTFEEPFTFLLTYSLLLDRCNSKGLHQQKEVIGYKFYWFLKEKKNLYDTSAIHRKQPKARTERALRDGVSQATNERGASMFLPITLYCRKSRINALIRLIDSLNWSKVYRLLLVFSG